MEKIKKLIRRHIAYNSIKYFLLILFYVIGITGGAIFVNSLPSEKSDELMGVISGFCTGISDGEIRAGETFRQSMSNNLKTVALLYICAISAYLIPLIYLHMAARGFVIGFTVGFMSVFFGFKGFLFVFVSVLPQSIILIPTIMAMSVLSHNYLINKKQMLKNYFPSKGGKGFFLKFSYATLVICLFMVASAVVDAFAIPVFVKAIVGVF
ncbi:MAG: stage II sporulation protein M [Firmicutes bacterium]|nr:stage II sporulation protein M [Bacillota bacterium]